MLLDNKWVTSCIALGSNLGDRAKHMDDAVAFLRDNVSADHWAVESPRFETEPVDCPPGSPPFLNSVLLIHSHRTDWSISQARILLSILIALEEVIGREAAHELNAPRVIDLDLIFYGDTTANTAIEPPELILPHPRAHLRRFVLEPLSHLLPDHVLPEQNKTVSQLLAGLKGPPCIRQVQPESGNSPSASPT